MFTEDLGMNGVELLRDAVEQLGPFGLELTIHQALRLGPVGNPGKAVVLLQVIQTGGMHLSRPGIRGARPQLQPVLLRLWRLFF
jgi:hypothetical protein